MNQIILSIVDMCSHEANFKANLSELMNLLQDKINSIVDKNEAINEPINEPLYSYYVKILNDSQESIDNILKYTIQRERLIHNTEIDWSNGEVRSGYYNVLKEDATEYEKEEKNKIIENILQNTIETETIIHTSTINWTRGLGSSINEDVIEYNIKYTLLNHTIEFTIHHFLYEDRIFYASIVIDDWLQYVLTNHYGLNYNGNNEFGIQYYDFEKAKQFYNQFNSENKVSISTFFNSFIEMCFLCVIKKCKDLKKPLPTNE
jgi:hypothetical protein